MTSASNKKMNPGSRDPQMHCGFMFTSSSMYKTPVDPWAAAASVPKDTAWGLTENLPDVSQDTLGLPRDTVALSQGGNNIDWGLPEEKSVTFEDNGECMAMDISGE